MSDLDGAASSSSSSSSFSASSSFANISEPSASQPTLIDHTDALENDEDEDEILDDLPSPSEPDSDSDSSSKTESESENEEESDAEREWRESIQQFELLMSLVVVPYLGKYFGRKFAYWGWKQFMEWKYPVEVVVTNKAAFKGAGVVGVAAASL